MKTASQAKMKTAYLKRYIQDEDRILGKKEMKTASFKVTSQMKTAFEETKR